MVFRKSSLVSAMATASVGAHFPACKETDTHDTKGLLDSRRSKCPLSFADLGIDVKRFIGRGNGDVVE